MSRYMGTKIGYLQHGTCAWSFLPRKYPVRLGTVWLFRSEKKPGTKRLQIKPFELVIPLVIDYLERSGIVELEAEQNILCL